MKCLLFGVQLTMRGMVAGHEALVVWGTVDRGGWRGART